MFGPKLFCREPRKWAFISMPSDKKPTVKVLIGLSVFFAAKLDIAVESNPPLKRNPIGTSRVTHMELDALIQ